MTDNLNDHPIINKEDLEPQGTEKLLDLQRLSRLVRRLVKHVQEANPDQVKPSTEHRTDQLDEAAINWAAAAWKTIYIALTARCKRSFFSEHPIDGAPAEDFIVRYAKYYKEEKAIKWLKFHTSYVFACSQGQELPTNPFPDEKDVHPGILAGGWVYKYLHSLMRGTRRGSLARAADILYSKYGMPKAPDSFVVKTLEAHEKALTTPVIRNMPLTVKKFRNTVTRGVRDPPEPLVKKFFSTTEETHSVTDVTQEVTRQVKIRIAELCDDYFSNDRFEARHLIPKPSACFERSTKEGGQITELIDQFWSTVSAFEAEKPSKDMDRLLEVILDNDRLDVSQVYRSLTNPSFWLSPVHLVMAEFAPGEVREFHMSAAHEIVVCAFEAFVTAVAEHRIDTLLSARQFGILEPLKCRVIMMAQAVEMYLSTVLQQWMHRVLRKIPIFEFIGAPDTESKITSALGAVSAEGEEFVSGDYEAATDNVSSEFSEFTWSCIARSGGVVGTLDWLGRKCLTGHLIHPAKIRKVDDVGRPQANGQSMGSPMSFPILCIINYACWSVAYGHPGCRQGPVRVNGDDIAFRGRVSCYDTWWNVNRLAGLKPSVGKNYRSKEFVNINSHCYYVKDGCFKRCYSVNVALAQDMVRKGIMAGKPTGIPWFAQKANFDYLVEGHRERVQRNLRSFLVEHLLMPKGVAVDLGSGLGGPGFLVGDPSFLCRCQTAIGLCRERDFVLKRPRPDDRSWAGKVAKHYLEERTRSIRITREAEALRTAHDSGGTISVGDLLYELIVGRLEYKGDCVRANPLLGARDYKEGLLESDPKYLWACSRFTSLISRFYEEHTKKVFRVGKRSRLYPADIDTCRDWSRDPSAIKKETVGVTAVRPLSWCFYSPRDLFRGVDDIALVPSLWTVR